MNIEEFIALQRLKLQKDSERFSARQKSSRDSVKRTSETKTLKCDDSKAPPFTTARKCPAEQLLQSPHFQPKACRRAKSADSTIHKRNSSKNNANLSQIMRGNELPRINSATEERYRSPVANTMSSLATNNNNNDGANGNDEEDDDSKASEATSTFMMYTSGGPEAGNDNNAAVLVPVNFHLDLGGVTRGEEGYEEIETQATEFQKSAKNFVNEHEYFTSNSARSVSNNDEDSQQDQTVKEDIKQQEQKQRPLNENDKDKKPRKKKDDMEQWVTDTFYSYFPGYNNENEKRQNYLRERQLENQQNFLKHQMLNPPLKKHAHKLSQKQQAPSNYNMNTTQGSSNSNNTAPSTTDKTDLEIIVNNPNYVPPKYLYMNGKSKPSATRRKLLQDLDHVGLSNIVTGDGIVERNRRSAEVLETARKRDYQRDLMQQIDEKRRSIELLREKERKQDEALTRRLETQLKAMKLEEQKEKERVRKEKARLLANLENDSKILYAKQQKQQYQQQQQQYYQLQQHYQLQHTPVKHKQVKMATTDAAAAGGMSSPYNNNERANLTGNNLNNKNNVSSTHANKDNNKVYKYFSNSARHEYRRGQPLPVDVEFELDMPEMAKIERECFHLCEKICPMCDEPLKSYESCCLRCQRKLALRMKGKTSKSKSKRKTNANGLEKTSNDVAGGAGNDNDVDDNNRTFSLSVDNNGNKTKDSNANDVDVDYDDDGAEEEEEEDDHPFESCRSTFALVCLKCERLYALCATCLAQNDVCRACHQKRNICMNCRRTLCTFCLEEIACGKDTERTHVNELTTAEHKNKQTTQGNTAFRVLELNYAGKKDTELMDEQQSTTATPPSPPPPRKEKHLNRNIEKIQNKLVEDSNSDASNTTIINHPPPYSMNIAPGSIFHPDYKQGGPKIIENFDEIPIIVDKSLNLEWDSESEKDAVFERVRLEANKRISRLVKNYGDLEDRLRSKSESNNRSTQTTPLTAGRRDVIMQEGTQNLSMPLLREMPKMTRHDSSLNENAMRKNGGNIDNLKRRWEVPAVQKFTISTSSPKVLTQVGAIRKQLQAERFYNEEDYKDY